VSNRSSWPPRGRIPRPFDVESLARALGLLPTDTAGMSLALGIGRRWVRRYRLVGLSERQADRWATAGGLHPGDVWPSWWTGGDVWPESGDLFAEQVSSDGDATSGQVAGDSR
jgi:hypothetical protein